MFIYLSATTVILFVLITMVHLDFLHIDEHSVSLQRLVLDNKAAVEAFTNDPITPNAADIYYTSFGNGAMFRTGTYIALTIVADIFIVRDPISEAFWNSGTFVLTKSRCIVCSRFGLEISGSL